ncbi:MAG TPA: di-trans,poly-cis-decaprenylcistransferase [Armatimonadetes bacterium]|jgi:undecaprenyl diphosphate synthase|nr:di-trans,poly-cis-decaprenylcistransferase [Armatimonadota bacterium]
MSVPDELLSRLEGLKIPRHVAVIMDGNGRWAEERGVPHLQGHAEGSRATRRLVRTARDIGVEYVSVYAFSTENWSRSSNEVSGLMQLMEMAVKQELAEMQQLNIHVVASGRLSELPASLQAAFAEAEEATSGHSALTLNVCINYGGRAEIIDAVARIAADTAAGTLRAEDISEESFREYLYRPEIPDPDLLIRTSGEMRISNFLLWEIAYAEFVVLPIYWPDFDAEALVGAVEQYNARERRFGARPG